MADITLDEAHDVAKAARKKAAEISTKMDIAVVDAGANLKFFIRMDGAWLDEHSRWESATTQQLIGQQALLASDEEGQRAAFARALALNPEDREPWEAFGVPAWVSSVAEDAASRSAH